MRFFWVFILCAAATAMAADPVVTNVTFTPRTDGSKLVDIGYDVADADGDSMFISVQISEDDGATWGFPGRTFTGDVGAGVTPGTGKLIQWNVGLDAQGNERGGFVARVIASDVGVSHWGHSPSNYAVFAWELPDWNDPGLVEKYARADFLVLTGHFVWGNPQAEARGFLDEIRAVNPDITIISYVSAKNSTFDWVNYTPSSPFTYDWYVRTKPFWSITTEGDTLSDWYGKATLNILEAGCREAMVSTIAEYERTSVNHFDGVFWDYFNRSIWVAPGIEFEGLPDMDGNGIEHRFDENEKQAFRDAQTALVQTMSDTMGTDYIQFFNGQRAYEDSTFAAMSDGIWYELFPTLFFPDKDMVHALDPDYEYNLFRINQWPRSDNGGPWVVLSNRWENYYQDNNYDVTYLDNGNSYRVVASLVGCYNTWGRSTTTYRWPDQDFKLGLPTGPVQISGDNYARDFQYGRIEMIMKNGTYPNPFQYTIWLNNQIVESLAIPYHYP